MATHRTTVLAVARRRAGARSAGSREKLARLAAVLALAALLPSRVHAATEEPMFVDLAGRTVHASDHRGEVVVLNFWSTWCAPCRHEMPILVRLHDAYGSRGVKVIGAAADGRNQAEPVQRAMKELGVRFEVWLWVSAKDMAYYGVGPGIPATVVLDRAGAVRARVQGIADEARLRQVVDEVLAEPAPAKR